MNKPKAPGQVRIIGGLWRGSKLPVPDRPGLRPTADRVRETLFNWLARDLHGATGLDAFSGSGALGFEAASRGAARVVLLEHDPTAAATLRKNIERLGAANVVLEQGDALAYLQRCELRFDVVFLDPPFAFAQWPALIAAVDRRLQPGACVYVETAIAATPELPQSWHCHRELRTREVRAALYRLRSPADMVDCPGTLPAPD